MIRVMIVDDEYIVRLGISSLLDWEAHGYTMCGMACDGEDALSKIDTLQPDILLTDIIMSPMDGLRLMDICAYKYPQIRFIMLSNSTEFNYVKKALQLGACDYIFKLEINQEALLSALASAQCKADASKSIIEDRFYLQHSFLDAWLSGEDISSPNLASISDRLNIRLDSPAYRCSLFSLDCFSSASSESLSLRRAAQGIIEKFVSEMPWCTCMWWKDLMFAVLFPIPAPSESIEKAHRKIADYAERYLCCHTFCAVSEAFSQFKEFPSLLLQTERMLLQSFYTPDVNFYRSKYEFSEHFDLKRIHSDAKRLSEHLLREEEDIWQNCVRQMVSADVFRRYFPDTSKKIIAIFLESLCMEFSRIFGSMYNTVPALPVVDYVEIQKAHSFEELRGYLLEFLQHLSDLTRQAQTPPEILVAKQYIMTHLHQRLSLSEVAQHINISEGYLSHIFKKETGVNFVDYVNTLKIEKAKAFLSRSSLKINEIASAVGFDNSNYFTILFKRLTGCTPGYYREHFKSSHITEED